MNDDNVIQDDLDLRCDAPLDLLIKASRVMNPELDWISGERVELIIET